MLVLRSLTKILPQLSAILIKINKEFNNFMTVTTEDGGRQNLFAKEPQMKVMEVTVTHNEKAEQLNGRVAMMGIIAALGAYALTGHNYPWHLVKQAIIRCKYLSISYVFRR